MSRSPEEDSSQDAVDGYRAGWEAVMRLVREGRSWSGNERNNVLANLGGGRFADVSSMTGLDFPDDGRGLAAVDWDRDGDLDLWFRNRTAPRLRLMVNRTVEDGGGSSVALRLVGVGGNRDAVGARVDLTLADPAGTRLVRTVRAGNGYLSQGSKWLHFGLGAEAGIASVTVRWPWGKSETFEGIEPGGRYRLIQGTGRASPLPRRPPPVLVADVGVSARDEAAAEAARVVLAEPPPLPELAYSPWDGADDRSVAAAGNGPLLLVLWASWCPPCVTELEEIARRAAEVRGADLRVLALSVDGVAEDRATDADDARALLERIGFSFPAGTARAAALDKVTLLERTLFDLPPPFGVPLGLLVDPAGNLAAIYRGRVELDTVLDDAERLVTATPAARRELARPAGGRWHGAPPNRFEVLGYLAQRFAGAHPEDGARYLGAAIDEIRGLRASLPPERRRGLDAREAAMHALLGEAMDGAGRPDLAVAHYRQVLQLRGDDPGAHNDLGVALARSGRLQEAVGHYREALALDPAHVEASHNLGVAFLAAGRPDLAVAPLRRALATAPDHGEAHYYLGLAFTMLGNAPGALVELREAVRLRPDDRDAANQAAWLLATLPDPVLRDPEEALRIARHAAELGEPDATTLDTLAAAQAAAGRFDEAVSTVERALARARSDGQEGLVPHLERRQALYSQGQPWVETLRGAP